MDEAQQILMNSLLNSGISLPKDVSSIKDLKEDSLVSICAQSLRLIDTSLLFSTSLPDSMAERFKICSEISSAVKDLGYRRDLSFHQFMYPSDEDSYKLVRFLVEKLSEISEGGEVARKEVRAGLRPEDQCEGATSKDREGRVDIPDANQDCPTITPKLEELKLKTQVPDSLDNAAEETLVNGLLEACQILQQNNNEPAVADVSKSSSLESTKGEVRVAKDVKELLEESLDSGKDASENNESAAQINESHVTELNQKLATLRQRSSKLRTEVNDLRSQEKALMKEVAQEISETQHLEDEHELLKEAVEMAFKDRGDFYIEELNKRVEAGKKNLVKLESQWFAVEESLVERKRSLEESFYAQNPKVLEDLQKVKEIELETEAIRSEIQKREEEYSRLSVELENQPKLPSRKSYIHRITEITKNSRKQDADIERILKETRDLQIESNSMQERLHRTYAVVDETMFREARKDEAKKDPVRRQAYILLTSIHDSFEQISEKILATDRTRRELTDQEAKLATMASRSLNIDKLQTDLESIRKENEFLEQQIQRS